MIYMHHNIYKNYLNADGRKDHGMKRDILISEIAKILAYNPKLAVRHLNSFGFKINTNPTTKQLVFAVSAALKQSQPFAKQMAIEIINGSYGADGVIGGQGMVGGPGAMPQENTPPPAGNTGGGGVMAGPTIQAPPNVNPGPLVDGLGTVFGGTNGGTTISGGTGTIAPNQNPTTVNNTPPPPQNTIIVNNPPLITPTVTSGGGGGGGGFGGGSGGGGGEANDSAKADLLAKTKALKGAWSPGKKVMVSLLLISAIVGGVAAYNHFK